MHIVLTAAQHVSSDAEHNTRSKRLVELASISRACHRAILSRLLLPDLCLYGFEQIRSFAVSLDQDRIGIGGLARTRLQILTLRARSLASLQHGYGPALFDASQAQTHFERNLVPFVRIIVSHCHALKTLHLEGVARGLERPFAQLSNRLQEYSGLMGHYGADLERDFWQGSRWSRLTQLQLHGPRFRFTAQTATTLAGLPRLEKLGLVVPMIVAASASPPTGASGQVAGIELDVTGSINPLQILIDRCENLQVLLLVGHAEKGYVGYTQKYRHWLGSLRQARLANTWAAGKLRLELVSALRRSSSQDAESMASRRVHPCEVSAWMMERARHGVQWFDESSGRGKQGELDFCIESFELALHPSTTSTAATSTLMSRSGSDTRAAAAARMYATRIEEAIDAVDMLSDDDEASADEP